MKDLQKTPASLHDLQDSYDRLYQGWMAEHKNIGQAEHILELLDVQPGRTLLDIACGLGYLADMASERGLDAVGIDISSVALEKAKHENEHVGLLLLGDAERLPWPDKTFDYAVNLGSLEHFINPAAAVCEMSRVLRSNGRAALLLPNSHHIRAIYNVYKYGEVFPDLQDFERFATRAEWERLLAENGLQVLSVHKYDTGMARVYKKGNQVFWYLYNIFFRLFGRWIPLNLTYTFIFICEPGGQADDKSA
jgi:ubiquinone/menaquinone biosynthesis C-methylase UbiE